jgi:hypothetical protein
MRQFRYRLQAALDRERALELEAARVLGAAGAHLEAALRAAAWPRAVPIQASARDFAWSASLDEAARTRVSSALAERENACRRLVGQRRRREALTLHRERCVKAFEAGRDRAAEAELEDLNGVARVSRVSARPDGV